MKKNLAISSLLVHLQIVQLAKNLGFKIEFLLHVASENYSLTS